MHEPTHRRVFLKRAFGALATVSLGLPSIASKDENSVLPIVDTHQHLWDLNKFKLPWLKNYPSLSKSFLTADYLKAVKGLNVVKSIYMEVDVDSEQQDAEADYVLDICQNGKSPMVAAVISGRPESKRFKKYITRFKDNKFIKGVRRVLHNPQTPAGYCRGDQFKKSVQLLGELGMSYDLVMRPTELADGGKLIDACPDTRFILDHCGNANLQAKDSTGWKRDMAALAKRKNLVCKVSGIVASAIPGKWTADDLAPFIKHTAEVFGMDRVMFGGDWPVCTLGASYREWVDALKTIIHDWKREDQKKLFHDNAIRFYGLK